jgi:alpha-glucosidase
MGRDGQRAPMQWDESSGRGFSVGQPWLPFGPIELNVQRQSGEAESLLNLYRRAIWMRRQERSLLQGAATASASNDVCTVLREAEGARPVLVAVNTARDPREVALPRAMRRLLLATNPDVRLNAEAHVIELPPLGAAWVTDG